uniref:Uncharacterized protein n=1 Tax=Arundo donax TaxID=35708 RepID=A0A0A9BTI0_ARUDO
MHGHILTTSTVVTISDSVTLTTNKHVIFRAEEDAIRRKGSTQTYTYHSTDTWITRLSALQERSRLII